MVSFSGLGIGLSFLFGCILLGLVGELYYLLWWKRRVTNREIEDQYYNNHAKYISNLFCWKNPSCFINSTKSQQATNSVTNPDANVPDEPDLELGLPKPKGFGEESVESELMRLHNLCGPPRFLFTIKEETKEDLESVDGKSRKGSRTRSLSDVLVALETPILTPLASPTLRANNLEAYNHHGFNPLFESSTEAELNRLRSSPPPKFKFLRDAEEKLIRRLVEEAEKRVLRNGGSVQDCVAEDHKDGSFIRIIVGKNRERESHHQIPVQYHSNVSQVLPLASSPSAFRPLGNNKSTEK